MCEYIAVQTTTRRLFELLFSMLVAIFIILYNFMR